MAGSNTIQVDPWLKEQGSTALPSDAVFLCTYDDYIGIDTIEVAAFIRRTAGREELWITSDVFEVPVNVLANNNPLTDMAVSVAASRPVTKVALSDAGLALFEALFEARIGFRWPTKHISSGLVSATVFENLVSGLETRLNQNVEESRRTRSKIVDTASNLQLNPEPGGLDPDYWRARCAETHHHLELKASTNEFFCGYCGISGGPCELMDLAKDRKEKATARQHR